MSHRLLQFIAYHLRAESGEAYVSLFAGSWIWMHHSETRSRACDVGCPTSNVWFQTRSNVSTSKLLWSARVLDSGSNAAVEKTIDLIRSQAMVYIHALIQNLRFEAPRGTFFLLAFSVKAVYDLVSGDGLTNKGDTKWKHGILWSKSLSNGVFVTSVDGRLR